MEDSHECPSASQETIKEAIALYEDNPEKAKALLTRYCLDMANSAVDAYWKLADDLWTTYHKVF
jgi:hypothetical protein